MMLSQVTNFFKQNKKIMYYLGFFAVIYFAFGDSVFANSTTGGEGTQTGASEGVKWFNGFIQIISTGIGILSNIVGVFLNPSWTNATGIGLAGHLKSLWIMVSNVVYFIFAILIVVIAFMNILGKGDKWELKQALPKFIIGVLIVPFSWFFVQFVLSISSILSASVLLLPYDTLTNSNPAATKKLMEQPICNTFVIINTGSGKTANTTQGCGNLDENNELGTERTGTDTVGDLLQGDGIYGLLSVYTYGIFSTGELSILKEKEIDSFASLFKLGINTIVVFLLTVVYFILLVSLGLALFVRGVWLWLYMIFSPAFGLLYFFGKEKDGFVEGKFSISEFFALALVPVYVSAALAFGLLFTFVAGLSFNEETGTMVFKYEELQSAKTYTNQSLKPEGNGSRISFLDKFHVDLYGDYGTSGKKTFEAMGMMKSGIGTIIMQFFGLAVLWISVMAAMGASKITGAVVEPIAAFGKQVGGLVMKSPQYAPIFGGQSMESMKRVGGTITSHYQTEQSNKANEFLKNTKFGGNAQTVSEVDKIGQRAKNTQLSDPEIVRDVRKLISLTEGDGQKLHNNDNFKAALIALAERSGLKDVKIENIGDVTKVLQDMDSRPGLEGIFKGSDRIKTQDDVLSLARDLHSGKEALNNSGGTNSEQAKLDVSSGNPVINVGNVDFALSGQAGNYEVSRYQYDDFAEEIANGNIGEDIIKQLSDTSIKEITKYFDKDGKFIAEGNVSNGKLPFDVNQVSDDEEEA